MQIGVVSLIAFCQTVTGIHFYEWSNISFGKAFPVVTAITTLITHVVWGNEYLMSFCFFFPVLDWSTFYKWCVQIIVQRNMVSMFHTMSFVSYKSQEFTFLVILICHFYILLITAFTQTFESSCVIINHPFQAGIICSGNIRPHSMRSDTDKIQLSFRCFKSVAHVAVSVCDVAMVM